MKRCIYCKKKEPEAIFSTGEGEHVIPQQLGRFNLYFGDDIVCQSCNHELSKPETIFKEGSLAGIHSAVYGVNDDSSSIRICKKRVSWQISSDSGELGVFKDIFPFVRLGESKTYPKPIIILDHVDSRIKYVLFIEKYAQYAQQNSREFGERKESIERLKESFGKLNISIFGDINKGWTIDKVAELLKKYGLEYNKKTEEGFEDKDRGTRWTIDYEENGDKESLRIPAKIAFNYLAYCAKASGMLDILYEPIFDPMRRFIRYAEVPEKKYKPNFRFEKNPVADRGLHIITFQKEKNVITSFITLFGRFSYRFVLADYPFALNAERFGCATAFDPFSKEIINEIYSTPQPILGKPDYGLFCR